MIALTFLQEIYYFSLYYGYLQNTTAIKLSCGANLTYLSLLKTLFSKEMERYIGGNTYGLRYRNISAGPSVP